MQVDNNHNNQTHTVRILLLLLLIVLAYSNTFNASWHLDDMSKILHNPNVHVSSLEPQDWIKSVRVPFSGPEHKGLNLYRPVAMLTLAANWYLGGTSVIGYHLVNLIVHCLTAVLLFYTCLYLLRTPNMQGRQHSRDVMIAWLAAGLWALHPIQTQAVTYIVQRMASLATLFYLLGIFAYVKGRFAESQLKKYAMFGLCLLAFVLSVGSKQNAVTMPAALILIEVIFFSEFDLLKTAKGRWLAAGCLAGLAALAVLILYQWTGNFTSGLFDGYQSRPFTLFERVLTQFRVLLLYLYQIFYPVPQQFSIVHAMIWSTSLVTPWTTMAAIFGCGLLLGVAITFLRRFRLLAFAILFFFLGHSIESSIFPLELIFEHRNYLPTLFLFLPLASGLTALMDVYAQRNRVLYGILLVFAPLLVMGIGFATYTRNFVWLTEKDLWQDAAAKEPTMARPHQALALAYENEGRFDQAYDLYKQALTLDDPDPENARFNSLANMGNILKKQQDYQGAVRLLSTAVELDKKPFSNKVRFNLVLCLLNTNQMEKALEHIDVLIERRNKSYRYLSTKGFILFLMDDVDGALHFLRLALKQNPNDLSTLLNLGATMGKKGAYERGAWYLKRAEEQRPRNLVIHLNKLQNALMIQDAERTGKHLSQIARLFSIQEVQSFFYERAKGYHYIDGMLVLLDDCMILPPLKDHFQQIIGDWVLDIGEPTS